MAKVVIDPKRCKGCLFCVKVCPKSVLAQGSELNEKGYSFVQPQAPENCIGCTLCAVMCPDCAIEIYR